MSRFLSDNYIVSKLPERPRNAHKGTFGRVLIVAGSDNFPGAAYLACAASLRVGAGLVTLATVPFVKQIVAKKLAEVTFLSFKEVFKSIAQYDVLLFGPGLGQGLEVRKLIEEFIDIKFPRIVIDADGLNILSGISRWQDRFKIEAVLTPHPGEMSRLTGLTIEEIQKNRGKIALEFAKKWKQTLVLKGANTIIVSPAGEVKISPFANPALATAGTGDVLSGIISGFLAQGLSPFDAACVGVYLHGLAGEKASEKLGNAGVIASDLLSLLPQIIKELI